jgi:hypothetical protein
MSKEQVKAVLDRVLTWPSERQEDAAKLLMLMESQDESVYRLTDEQVEESGGALPIPTASWYPSPRHESASRGSLIASPRKLRSPDERCEIRGPSQSGLPEAKRAFNCASGHSTPKLLSLLLRPFQAIGYTMLDEKRIREIVQEVANANLTSANITSVSSSAAVDSEGHDALRITIVIKPGSASKIKGDATLDTLVGIQDRLRAEGEERFPIVEYATKKELSASGGS